MLRLKQLEIEGFGPFADRQIVTFPPGAGVVVIYGENMRGKTILLNAIRYAFFGRVLGRGRRERLIHVLSNRDRAADGRYGFGVTLGFEFDGESYELFRRHAPKVPNPVSDNDYQADVLLKRGGDVLGQQERERLLAQIFPWDISRFFLFDGELLQEYEELIINESETGPQISNAIERILGVPILKAGRRHLRELAEEAERRVASEASRHVETAGIGNALAQALTIRDGQRFELDRLRTDLEGLTQQKTELEEKLASNTRTSDLMKRRQDALDRASQAARSQQELRVEVKRLMADGWRSVLLPPVRQLRDSATEALGQAVDDAVFELRRRAASDNHCEVCDQDVEGDALHRLTASLERVDLTASAEALGRLRSLRGFEEMDISGAIRLLIRRIEDLHVEEQHSRDEANELLAALADSDQASVRSIQAVYAEVLKQIGILERGVEEQERAVVAQEGRVDNLKRKLQTTASAGDLTGLEARAKLLRESEAVFEAAIHEYKQDLRQRVERSATELFLAMTTERVDYAGLRINDDYGLTIMHVDGRPEDARSAGAEHIVALALMGALQQNAPLRGPIVMDSPFGRLDAGHTSNVLRGLHRMADQVVLLVYEAEVGREQARALLGPRLAAEYELRKVNSRRTNIVEVQR